MGKKEVVNEIKIIKDLEAMGVELFPDNDGGLWYFDPVDGTTKYI
jgi:fructose-1,6-bisphosphatase/inositol monophosphatase family enzyme